VSHPANILFGSFMSILFACNIAVTAFLTQTPVHSGVYDFYVPSVKRGQASFEFDEGQLVLKSDPGFAPSSKLTVTLDDARPSKALFTSAKGVDTDYTIASDGTVSKAGQQVAKGSLYSPFHPMLLRYLLDQYKPSRKGFQSLEAIDLGKGIPREVQAELFRTELRTFNGQTKLLREWRIETPPSAEAVVWTDTSNAPLYWWVPKVNFEAVLRGCEDLRPSTKYANAVSPPRFTAKVEKNVWVPMRDGVRLQADVYRPEAEGRFPVILQRTVYDRSEFGDADGMFYAQRGYVYVTQHARGRGGSEGNFVPTLNEAEDGYDTVRWCGTQPWSSGRVGMVGASYNGFCAWMAAKSQPKWLKTIISVVPMPGAPDGAFWDHGATYISDSLWWFGLLRDRHKVQPFTEDLSKAMNTLPLSKVAEVQFGKVPPGFYFGADSNTFDAQIRKSSYRFDMKGIDLPVLFFDGWLDPVSIATKKNYLTMVGNHRKNQKLIWGPWDHFTNQESKSGVTDFGPDGYMDMRTTCLRWYDRWLKGMPNGIDKEPPVSEFLIGEGWRRESQWPPKAMKPQRWYLQPNGILATRAPTRGEPSRYVYDPSKDVYSSTFNSGYFMLIGDDASSNCKRKDQLLFDSAPLKKPLRLDGPISASLFASTSAKDTDWVMTLIDRHPDGVCVPLDTGFVRARYRKSLTHPSLLKPGEIVPYQIDLWQTGITIPAGHQLRVVVCSSMYPDADRNLNTGEPIFNATRMVVARQTIYHDPSHPSSVMLPVLPDQLRSNG